jgi:DNA-binding NarL/FixJ family response regulator
VGFGVAASYDPRVLDPASTDHDIRRDAPLSPREREVLDLAALGLTNRQIALQLHLSVHAVKFHLVSIYRKLGVSNRTEAAVTYLRSGAGDSAVV